jgi:Tfp pilus assembly protein PilF
VHGLAALKIDSTHADVCVGLGYCYHMVGNLDSSEYYYRRAVQLAPQNPTALYYFGYFWLSLQQHDSCAHYLKQFLTSNPPDSEQNREARRILDSLGF